MKENKFKQAEIGLIPEDYGDRLGDIGRLRIWIYGIAQEGDVGVKFLGIADMREGWLEAGKDGKLEKGLNVMVLKLFKALQLTSKNESLTS